MRCNFDRLIAYLNDSLSEGQTHDVFVHLQGCEICLEAVETMLLDRRTIDLNQSLVEEQAGRIVEPCQLVMFRM
jgi:hypothetical protein